MFGQGVLHLTMPYKRRNAKNWPILTHFRNSGSVKCQRQSMQGKAAGTLRSGDSQEKNLASLVTFCGNQVSKLDVHSRTFCRMASQYERRILAGGRWTSQESKHDLMVGCPKPANVVRPSGPPEVIDHKLLVGITIRVHAKWIKSSR
jgi:hypothetical protein